MNHRVRRRIASYLEALSRPLTNMGWRLRDEDPLGDRPSAPAEHYRELWSRARLVSYPPIDAYEARTGFAIDKGWLDALALQTQTTVKKSALMYQHGRVLYSALRSYVQASSSSSVVILETGTALGFSCLCMAKALQDSRVEGRIISLDVLPSEKPIFWNSIGDHAGRRTRSELLHDYSDLAERYLVFYQGDSRDILPRLAIPRVNFAFFDAEHTYGALTRELSYLSSRQRPGDMVVLDDYSPDRFPGIVRAVGEWSRATPYDLSFIDPGNDRSYVVASRVV